MNYCTDCGNVVKKGQLFCTECGQKLESKIEKKPNDHTTPELSSTSKSVVKPVNKIYQIEEVQEFRRYRKKEKLSGKLISSVIIIGLVTGGVYYFLSQDKVKEVSTKQILDNDLSLNDQADDKLVQNELKEDVQIVDEENNKEIGTEIDLVARALDELKELSLDVEGLNISVGEWEIQEANGSLIVGANSIPEKDLEKIFSLYDSRNFKPLKDWAKEVFYIVSELGEEKNMDWSIFVGNNCTAPYPKTLPLDLITGYSGSCGYSIPVLSGNNEENYTLVLNEKVFSDVNEGRLEDNAFIFPDSSVIRLSDAEIATLTKDELSLARNEIFARNGYIFNSDELQDYFSRKNWYHPNPHYDSYLNEIEKYNVDLIKRREEQLQ